MDPTSLGLLALMVVAFYFVLIRPQQRRLKQHQQLIQQLKPGDEVVTIGGMYGRVTQLDDASVWLEVADSTVIRFSRQAIGRTITADADPPSSSDADDEEAPEE